MTPAEARAQFPVFERVAYLNAGSEGPLARPTLDAMAAALSEDAAHGRGSTAYVDRLFALRDRTREQLAGLLTVGADRVALTGSTSDSVRIVLAGLRLGPGDEILTSDSEHFGLVGPLHASGATVRPVPVRGRTAAEALDGLVAAVTPRTRLLALQHVSWMTGQVLPIAELKEATGLPMLVDGAQAAGAIPVDASGFDFYTVSAQKWLCGPDSTGALVVADPEALPVALPGHLAPCRFAPDGSFEPRTGAARFDWGWIGAPTLAGLAAALDFHPEWRYERAAEMAARCRDVLGERFDVVGEPGHGTLVSVRARERAADVVARALDRGVVLREIPQTGLIRVSCGYWTNEDDLERLVEALTT
jgi:L-cysteine/cystine lyase